MLALPELISVLKESLGAGDAAAAITAPESNITDFVKNIVNKLLQVKVFINTFAYTAGIALVLGSLFKFKQHKDNPTQIPVGTPVTLMLIGAAMLAFPGVINLAGQTLLPTADGTTDTILKTIPAMEGATTLGGLIKRIAMFSQQIGFAIRVFATVAGTALFLGGLFKLKQHKDNPTQIPVGTPISM